MIRKGNDTGTFLRAALLASAVFFLANLLAHTAYHVISESSPSPGGRTLSFLLINVFLSVALGLLIAFYAWRRFLAPLKALSRETREWVRETDPLPAVSAESGPLRDLSLSIVSTLDTARKRIHLLNQQRKELERLFEVVPCYISVQDRNFHIIHANRLFREAFGDISERPCYEVYKNRGSQCPNCSVAKTFQDGEIHSNEEVVITRNGEEVSLIVYSAPIRDEKGTIVAVMEMSTDITEIKRLQQEVGTQRQQFEQLFNMVPCYISIQDRDFNVLQANEMFRNAFGSGQKRKKCYRVYKGAEVPCRDCPVVKTFEDGQVHFSEEMVVTGEGKDANVIVYTAPIHDESGNVTSVMEMSTDITSVKSLQRELILMGQTIASTAHRIKNILMGLEGGIFVVSTALEDEDDELLKQGWDMVNRNVEKVTHIVKGLLYCSKQRTPQFTKQDPNRVVREVYNLFKEKALEEDIGMDLDLAGDLPEADLDPDSIHDMLSNLISNALDACKFDSSKLEHWVRLRTHRETSDRIVYEVSDNGPGIPNDVKHKVFENFFSTKGEKGTGLGLQIARKIVEEHNGEIDLSSELNQGTTFRITLPVHQALLQ